VGEHRANVILAVVTGLIATAVGALGWAVLNFSRGPDACRAHDGVEVGLHSTAIAPAGYVICKDGVTVPLDPQARHK
jgi:ammonia channel protein AmtB